MSITVVAPAPRISLTQTEAAESLGVSLSTLRRYILPTIKSIKVGNCSLISVAELSKWAQESGTLNATGEPLTQGG